MLIKKILKEIYRDFFPQKFSIDETSERQIKRLRKNGAKIGENVVLINSNIDSGFYANLLTIGNNVTITNATCLLHDASTKIPLNYTKVGKIEIGNDVFIGLHSIVLPGTTIGSKVIVGAGTVLRGNIPDNSVVAGNPWTVLCTYDEYISKHKEKMSSSVVCDLYPEVLNNPEHEDARNAIAKNGKGYIL